MKTKTNPEQGKNKEQEVKAKIESGEVVCVDFEQLKEGLGGFVRGTVEEALNGLLEAEAEHLCSEKRHGRRRRSALQVFGQQRIARLTGAGAMGGNCTREQGK